MFINIVGKLEITMNPAWKPHITSNVYNHIFEKLIFFLDEDFIYHLLFNIPMHLDITITH